MAFINKNIFFLFLIVGLLLATPSALADGDDDDDNDDDDLMLFGVEAEEFLAIFSGLLAVTLSVLTVLAYRRSGKNRLLFVALAFGLFAIRSFIEASEIFLPEVPIGDLGGALLDFVILVSFFLGILKK